MTCQSGDHRDNIISEEDVAEALQRVSAHVARER